MKESTIVLPHANSEKDNNDTAGDDFSQALEILDRGIGAAEAALKKRRRPLNLQEQARLLTMLERMKRLR